MINYIKQRSADCYQKKGYDNKQRFCSYWHQINEVINIQPESILDIGVGSGFFSRYIKHIGFNITTLDIDPELKPDINGNILTLPFKSNSFEIITCFQVLEHLPFDNLEICLRELFITSNKWVLISLPDATRTISLTVNSTYRSRLGISLNIPRIRKLKQEKTGEHYWEIGKRGYNLQLIKDKIIRSGFNIVDTYRVLELLYHRFFILHK
jgi:ubiquinone/menaquinone biosynthesis C-methylase UbiE